MPQAKRRLSDLSFDHTGAHLALCSKSQGAANGVQKALVIKASANFTEETILKMQKIQVTMELPEFLEKFFNVYGTSAQVLARLMGYVPEEKEPEEYDENWYENLIQERLESFTILKSLYVAPSFPEAMSKLSEENLLNVLKTQESLEKILKTFETQNTEVDMSKPEDKTAAENAELIEKAAKLVELEKAMNDQKIALEKALAQVATFEAEKKEAIRKSRLAVLTDVVKDEKKVEVLFKALSGLEADADYTAVIDVLKGLMAAVDNSEMFKEAGAGAEGKTEISKAKNPVADKLKAKYAKK